MIHFFDYAGDGGYKIPLIKSKICNVNHRKDFKYNLEFCASKVEDIDLKAIFLGKVREELTLNGQNPINALSEFAFNHSKFENSKYSIRTNNCRHFSHVLARFLGVEKRYLEIIDKY
jgi:hypothetical protein